MLNEQAARAAGERETRRERERGIFYVRCAKAPELCVWRERGVAVFEERMRTHGQTCMAI